MGDIATFDTQHLYPFIVAEIAHLPAFRDPGIPHDRVRGMLFCDDDATREVRVFEPDFRAAVCMNSIGLACDHQGVLVVGAVMAAFDLVEVVGLHQAVNAYVPHA